tara:strand:- start:305 stop:475 length:171 start_codon:yes stop_codon:yes gene_type:complete
VVGVVQGESSERRSKTRRAHTHKASSEFADGVVAERQKEVEKRALPVSDARRMRFA